MIPIKPRKQGELWLVDTGRYLPKRQRRRFPAKAQADAFIKKLSTGNTKPISNPISSTIDQYLIWSEKIAGKSFNTVRSDRARLNIFRQWSGKQDIQAVGDITVENIRAFQEYYFSAGPFASKPFHRAKAGKPTAATWEKYRQVLSAFFNWCKKRNLVVENPIADPEFKIKSQQKVPEIYTVEELQSIFDYLAGQNRSPLPLDIPFRLLAYTGMRLGELIRLKWCDVDLENRVIRLVKTKSKKVRSVPIHPDLVNRLEAMPTESNEYVIDSGHNEPAYSSSWYWKTLRNATNALGFNGRSVHSLRHTFAAHLVMAGVDIFTVKELLGHSDIKTTMVYMHFSPKHAQDAINKLPY